MSNAVNENAIITRPPNRSESLLREKFAESIANQSSEMDKLARQLITLELAIPGIYAAILKLVAGSEETLVVNGWHYAAFVAWLLALLCTLACLFPRRWEVDENVFIADTSTGEKALGIKDFFIKSAVYKRRWLLPAYLFFWLSIALAVYSG